MKGAEYLLKVFEKEGVHHVFLVPGMHVDPLVSAFQHFPTMQSIMACHEEGAAFMADGYAKVSGKFGVAAGIAGPGITNMVTGITCAHSDRTPLFVITGETDETWEGRGAFQDGSLGGVNDSALVAPVTMKRLRAYNEAVLGPSVDMLMRTMLNPATRGPVHFAFARALQLKEVSLEPRKLSYFSEPRFVDRKACEHSWKLFQGAKKIAILAGGGALHSNATEELVRFAEQYEIPVATTLGGKSVFPEDHRLSLGVLGWYGNPYAMNTLLNKEVDVLLVLGSRLNQVDTAKWSQGLVPKKALIFSDVTESDYYGNYFPDLFVLGDAAEYLRALNEAPKEKKAILLEGAPERKKWVEEIHQTGPNYYDGENLNSEIVPIHPSRVMHELEKIMPHNTILFSGEGASSFIASHYWKCRGPRQHFTQVKSISSMGWSICAAIGGKLAKREAPVVAIIGDGSMLMHGLEIQTAARYGAAVIFLLMNNGAHGNPQLRAKKIGPFEENALKLPVHDWAKVAEGLGVTGITVEKGEELAPAFKKALSLNKPVLIDIRTGNYPTPVKISPF
jgi:acetolactate synthase-1/2/3 large subunit